MNDYSINIKIDLGELLGSLHSAINAYVLPTVHQAVQAVASEAAYRWKDRVAKAKLWQGEKQPYIESIRWMMTGDFSALVSSDYELAEAIEQGRPARDMKKVLNTSMKVRASKDGTRYLIIPFRHQTPGNTALGRDMPPDIYRKAKKLDPSVITGTVTRPSGTGAISLRTKKPVTVPQQQYSWGGKLPAGLSQKLKPHHVTDIHDSMYRFKSSAGKGKSSIYMTFRVMSEKSKGWIIPAKPGLFIAQGVKSEIGKEAPLVFAQAIAHLK